MKHREQSLYIVATVVVLAHMAAIYWVAAYSETPFFPKAEKRLVVNTVAVRQPKPAESKPEAKPPPSKREEKPAPVVSKKPVPQKKVLEVKKTTVVKKDPLEEKKRQLIANAQESIAKIRDNLDKSNASVKKTSSELKDLRMIESLRIDSPDIVCAEDKGYYGVLACRLRERLRLPEFGEVRIRLTLSRSGGVMKVETLSAESEYNRQYIEKMLPSLQFPSFGKNFGSEDQH
ncbi:MAG: hypothetical protein ACE5GN_05270, partial [Waddliaceae bacterium]